MRVVMGESNLLVYLPNLMRAHREPGTAHVFSNLIQFPVNNTIETCLSLCSEYGYAAAGLEVCGYPFGTVHESY